MKLINLTILFVSLLILSNAQSTEENPPSEDSSPSDDTPADGEPEEPTESSEPSSTSGDEEGQSSEPNEDDSTTPKADDDEQDQDQDQDAKKDKPKQSGKPSAKKGKEQGPAAAAATAAKGSYSATYGEIGKILDAVDFKSIDDLHLQRMLENTFQARLRNPIRDQTGQIADFSAIKSCFGKVGASVKKLINDAKKEFKTCKTGGGNSSGCTDEQENKFADGVINVATALQGCISSQRKN